MAVIKYVSAAHQSRVLPPIHTLDLPMPCISHFGSRSTSPLSSASSACDDADSPLLDSSRTQIQRPLVSRLHTNGPFASRTHQRSPSSAVSRLSSSPSPPPMSRSISRLSLPPLATSPSPSPPPTASRNTHSGVGDLYPKPTQTPASSSVPINRNKPISIAMHLPSGPSGAQRRRAVLQLVPHASLDGADAAVLVTPCADGSGKNRALLLVGRENVRRMLARPLAKEARMHPYRILKAAPATTGNRQ